MGCAFKLYISYIKDLGQNVSGLVLKVIGSFFCRMRYDQGLCVEGDGAVGKWFARSVLEIAQYGMAHVRELYAYLMMASGGEVHAH